MLIEIVRSVSGLMDVITSSRSWVDQLYSDERMFTDLGKPLVVREDI